MDPNAVHQFSIDYSTREGERVGSLGCEPDWEPARAWLQHLALRRDLPQETSITAPLTATPVWSEEAGAPLCRAVRVALAIDDEEVACELAPEYFRPLAEQLAQELVAEGKLERGDPFQFHVCSYPLLPATRRERQPSPDSGFQVEVVPDPIAVGPAPIAPLIASAERRGPHESEDTPVFLPSKVLAEASELARAAGELECGGILAGFVRRCPEQGDLFIEVTAAIPAQHGEATTGSFTFVPETWAAFDDALALRAAGESAIGWFHSHPQFCKRCPAERQSACVFARPFYSDDDKHLHRTVFPLGHQVGLLISDLPARGLVPALFGWRAGLVAERAYYEIPAPPASR